MTQISILDRPVMTAREAARQLRIPPSTVVHWLEGSTRYDPVLREEPTGSLDMTWGEVVEARYLRAYRQQHNVSMQQLRPFIRAMRTEFGIPYPLAHARPFVDGRRLLVDLQNRLDVPEEFRMVYEATTGQMILDPRVVEFLDRVDFSDGGRGEAVLLHPLGKDSPVVMNPAIASAASTVRGVRTEVIVELHEAGESPEQIAADFGLPLSVVKAAISWEWSKAA